eukprot:g41569.t1
MDSLENQLELLLKGGGIEMRGYDSPLEEVVPVTVRKTVCYIVAAVILNEQKEVVMMQEAKQECYGKWYLPAGRMEQNETIVQAVKREVQEETGLECDPYTLLSVEERGPRWIRFVFMARVTGKHAISLLYHPTYSRGHFQGATDLNPKILLYVNA